MFRLLTTLTKAPSSNIAIVARSSISTSSLAMEPAKSKPKRPAPKKPAKKPAKKAPSQKAQLEAKLNSQRAIVKPPKGPATSFGLFLNDMVQKAKANNENVSSVIELTRRASKGWKELNDSEKQAYTLRYEKLRKDHEGELRKWWQQVDRELVELENKRRRRHNRKVATEGSGSKLPLLKDPFAPKRPASAYLFFVKEHMSLGSGSSREDMTSQAKALGSQWRGMSEVDRMPYVEKAKADAERYKRELAAHGSA